MARPAGSKSGRKPPSGYPAVDAALGSFLAGLIEGEACFTISKQPKNTNHRCAFALTLRADDYKLIHELANATRLGRVGHKGAYRTSRPQVVWTIGAKSDCLQLVDVLTAYPLRGRKSLDFAIWSAAVKWWCGNDPTETRRSRDWTPLIYLKDRLSAAKHFSAEARPIVRELEGLSGDWPGFLAGFFTAEGTLGIGSRNRGEFFGPVAAIAVRADDTPLLREFRRRTGMGRLYLDARSSRSHPARIWSIRKGSELARLVEIFDGAPLRGRRAGEYEIWREAALEYASDRPRSQVQKRLRALRTLLKVRRTLSAASMPA